MKTFITFVLLLINTSCNFCKNGTSITALPATVTWTDPPTIATWTNPPITETMTERPTTAPWTDPTRTYPWRDPSTTVTWTDPTTTATWTNPDNPFPWGNPSTTATWTNPTTTAPWTVPPQTYSPTISKNELKSELERNVAQIKSGVSTYAAEVVRFESLSMKMLAERGALEKLKSVVTEYDKHYANDLELKLFLDEVRYEVDWAINSYAEIGLNINRTFCRN